jgi:hypothetical protein
MTVFYGFQSVVSLNPFIAAPIKAANGGERWAPDRGAGGAARTIEAGPVAWAHGARLSRIGVGGDEARDSLPRVDDPDAKDARISPVRRWGVAFDLVLHAVSTGDVVVIMAITYVPPQRVLKLVRSRHVETETCEKPGFPGVLNQEVVSFRGSIDALPAFGTKLTPGCPRPPG